MPHIVVLDLDGTLCNSKHREHLAKAGQWDEFHSLLSEDKPWPDIWALMTRLSQVHPAITFVGLTGRNEKYRYKTVKWLDHYEVEIDELLMRPDFDPRSDHELKPQLLWDWLGENGHGQADVWFVLEDRDKVVEAWRDLGYNCWQVRAGGY